jgi:hypothetical protein
MSDLQLGKGSAMAGLHVFLLGWGGVVLCIGAIDKNEWGAAGLFLLASAVAFGCLAIATCRS